MTRHTRIAALTFSLLISSAVQVGAQGVQTGTLRGTVVDAQQLPVPGVTVTVSSSALQGQRTTITGTDGTYVIRLLPAGDYQISFQLAGFDRAERKLTVPLGGSANQDVALKTGGGAERVDVVATSAPLTNPAVGLNIRQDEVEALATSRTLQGIATLSPGVNENTPNTGQLSINGAFAFDNVFMLNGVDVNDNLFGNPQGLFIEDAIEETQVLTSGISAEYGRFSGGVVNAVTKSGGNMFSGSFRVNFTNPSWTDETPFEVDDDGSVIERKDTLNETYEATIGGPILRDKVWFFGAGRRATVTTSDTLPITGVPFSEDDKNWRAEVKVTGTPVANHTLQGGYLNNDRRISNTPSFDFSIDTKTLGTRHDPNWYAFGNYRGILRSNLLAEGQYSERRYTFEGVGGTSTALADSPFITLTQETAHYNGRYFDATDPEERNNRQFTGNVTSFLEAQGRHELKGGYEWFRSQNTGGNSQSATSFVFLADYLTDAAGDAATDSSGRLIPVFVPNRTLVQNWLAQRGAILNVDNNSLYAQDHWAINPKMSADLGLRYERVRSEATGGIVGVDTDTIVPRLAFAYDVKGDGNVVLTTTYGHYSGRYNESQIGVNSNVGNPDLTIGRYTGPAGSGFDFAPGLNPANYPIIFGQFPTLNVFFDEGLSSPITKEFTVSGGTSVGARAFAEATYVWRNTSNFIEDFTELDNGVTEVVRDGMDFGTFTNVVYRNSDVPKRRYQAAILQGRYRLQNNWTVNGSWTIQLQNEGNYVGEASNQPGTPSKVGDYPEVFDMDRNFPIGRLPGFQRHRARLWSIYNLNLQGYGDLSFSGLWRIESGRAYSLVANGLQLTDVQEDLLETAGYVDAPSDQDLYFGGRGSETFPGYGVFDTSINYNIPIFRTLRPWLKVDIFNLLNNQKLVGFDTTIEPDFAGSLDSLGLPTTFTRADTFGQARSTGDFPRSLAAGGGRSFRMSLGFRF